MLMTRTMRCHSTDDKNFLKFKRNQIATNSVGGIQCLAILTEMTVSEVKCLYWCSFSGRGTDMLCTQKMKTTLSHCGEHCLPINEVKAKKMMQKRDLFFATHAMVKKGYGLLFALFSYSELVRPCSERQLFF